MLDYVVTVMSYDKKSFLAGLAVGRQMKGWGCFMKKMAPEDFVLSSASPFTLGVNNNQKNWEGVLEYSFDNRTWAVWDSSDITAQKIGTLYRIYLRGTGNTIITKYSGRNFVLTGQDIYCDGNAMRLLDYKTVDVGQQPTMGEGAFCYLFSGQGELMSCPRLPAFTLSESCYQYMFNGCGKITKPPELPAIALERACYSGMFYLCSSLKTAPVLPAKTMQRECYYRMFGNCTSLEECPELPATVLARDCYNWMFYGCTSIKSPVPLPVKTLAHGCYNGMYQNCSSLTRMCKLPALTLENFCYNRMFANTSIKVSETPNSEYKYLFRIPTTGTGSDGGLQAPLFGMVAGTAGTFTSTPTINTTYYTNIEPI